MQTPPDQDFVFHIERGRTAFPERPVNSERFLIGAGSNCHLQLGGDFPILHSVVVLQQGQLWIDAVVASPPLIVNGHPVRESVLQAGDVIEIGEFVFTVGRLRPSGVQAAGQPGTEKQIQDLSAWELVERIEEEVSLLGGMDEAREQGAAALLQAARQSAVESAEEILASDEQDSSTSKLLRELQLRAEELDRRERILNEHAARLDKVQEEIASQLQFLNERLGDESSQDSSELRLTA